MDDFVKNREAEKEAYDLWLRSLQPGAGVVLDFRHGNDYWLATVERRTATQIIVKTDGGREMRFNRNYGTRVGGDDRWGSGPRLVQMTPRIRDEMELRRLARWLDSLGERDSKQKPTLAHLKAMKKAFDRVTFELAQLKEEKPQ